MLSQSDNSPRKPGDWSRKRVIRATIGPTSGGKRATAKEGGWHGRTVNGQEMAEGSDGSGNELGMELGGGRSESWSKVNTGNVKRKRKKLVQKERSSMSEETDNEQVRRDEEEHKVIIRLEQEGASFSEWNQVLLTKGINKQVGEIKSSKSTAQWSSVGFL